MCFEIAGSFAPQRGSPNFAIVDASSFPMVINIVQDGIKEETVSNVTKHLTEARIFLFQYFFLHQKVASNTLSN